MINGRRVMILPTLNSSVRRTRNIALPAANFPRTSLMAVSERNGFVILEQRGAWPFRHIKNGAWRVAARRLGPSAEFATIGGFTSHNGL
jgi:hypothetical protein